MYFPGMAPSLAPQTATAPAAATTQYARAIGPRPNIQPLLPYGRAPMPITPRPGTMGMFPPRVAGPPPGGTSFAASPSAFPGTAAGAAGMPPGSVGAPPPTGGMPPPTGGAAVPAPKTPTPDPTKSGFWKRLAKWTGRTGVPAALMIWMFSDILSGPDEMENQMHAMDIGGMMGAARNQEYIEASRLNDELGVAAAWAEASTKQSDVEEYTRMLQDNLPIIQMVALQNQPIQQMMDRGMSPEQTALLQAGMR
jgi:hypothetical protein